MGTRARGRGAGGEGSGSSAEEDAGSARGEEAEDDGRAGRTASDGSDEGSGSSDGGAEIHWELTRSQRGKQILRGKGSRELGRMATSPGFGGSGEWGWGDGAGRRSASRASVAGRQTPAAGGGEGVEGQSGARKIIKIIKRATSEVPTRKTLRRGVRIGEGVVARMDRWAATRLGEQRARLRQRQAEANQLEDG